MYFGWIRSHVKKKKKGSPTFFKHSVSQVFPKQIYIFNQGKMWFMGDFQVVFDIVHPSRAVVVYDTHVYRPMVRTHGPAFPRCALTGPAQRGLNACALGHRAWWPQSVPEPRIETKRRRVQSSKTGCPRAKVPLTRTAPSVRDSTFCRDSSTVTFQNRCFVK